MRHANRLEGKPAAAAEERQRLRLCDLRIPGDAGQTLLQLLASPNVASRRGVYQQYDHQVQTNTVVAPGAGDAAVLRIKGTEQAIAVAIDGNGRQCFLDPYRGAQMVVAEVTRNLSCVGAEPLALTDCLNFGNPERPEIYYQLEQCIRGMTRACRALGVPVVSGNASLYNESQGTAIYPTPIVGGLGLLEDVRQHCAAGFREEGLAVILLGANRLTARAADLAGSEYLNTVHGLVRGRPRIDLGLEARVQSLCRNLIAGWDGQVGARLLGWRAGRCVGGMLYAGRWERWSSQAGWVPRVGRVHGGCAVPVGRGAVRRGAVPHCGYPGAGIRSERVSNGAGVRRSRIATGPDGWWKFADGEPDRHAGGGIGRRVVRRIGHGIAIDKEEQWTR